MEAGARHVAAEGDPRPPATAGAGLAQNGGLACLPPDGVRLQRGPTGALRATILDAAPRTYLQVQVHRAFPLSAPDRWAVLLDGEGHEIGMVEDATALADPESARLCAEELQLRYLTPHVLAVDSISEDTVEGGAWSPVLLWELRTDRGPLRLRLPNLLDHTRLLGPRRLLLWDRDGRRAEIPDVLALPETSRRWLRRYLWL